MGRHNVYLSDDLEQLANQMGLSLSAVLQAAILAEAQRQGVGPGVDLTGRGRFRKDQGGITRSRWDD